MSDEEALRTENLALRRENARLHKVIENLNALLMESIHDKASIIVDQK